MCIRDRMEADPTKLIHRNAFNIASMSFDPETIYQAIRKHVPQFELVGILFHAIVCDTLYERS